MRVLLQKCLYSTLMDTLLLCALWALRFLRKSKQLRMPISFVEVATRAADGSVEDTAGSGTGLLVEAEFKS